MSAAEAQATAEPAAVAETPAPEPAAAGEKTEEFAPAEVAKEMPQANAEDPRVLPSH